MPWRKLPVNAVAVYQRVDQAGQRLPIDERILADTDTLMIFGLDHMVAEEEASQARNRGAREFFEPRRDLSHSRTASRRRRVVGSRMSATWSTTITATRSFRDSNASRSTCAG